jgi:hypothetical protein
MAQAVKDHIEDLNQTQERSDSRVRNGQVEAIAMKNQ